MKQLIKVGLVLSALTIFAAAAIAGPVTGIWHGYIRFDPSKLPQDNNPNHQKMTAAWMKVAQSAKMTLTVKPDHTFTLLTMGGPKSVLPVTGTWAQTSGAIALTFKTPSKGAVTSSFVLSTDGRSLSSSKGPQTTTFVR